MLNKLVFFLFFPALVFAQKTVAIDTGFEKIVEKDCGGKKFDKTEVLPSLKISAEAFEDSLMLYLRSKNAVIKNSLIPFRFLLTNHSEIFNIKSAVVNPPPDQLILRDAILHFSNLWNPALQNSHIVCSYVILTVQLNNDKIKTVISQ